jgi:hypothetical protein
MHKIFITQSLTDTTIISFIQNRLREFGIENKEIELHLHNISGAIVEIIKAHFNYSHLLVSEEDMYFDEINYSYQTLVKEIKSSILSLNNVDRNQFVFIIIKVLDQIIFESKEEKEPLCGATIQAEKEIIKLIS